MPNGLKRSLYTSKLITIGSNLAKIGQKLVTMSPNKGLTLSDML